MPAHLPTLVVDEIELHCHRYPLDDDAKLLVRQSWGKISSLGADMMKEMLMNNLSTLASEVHKGTSNCSSVCTEDDGVATVLASIAAIVEIENLADVASMVQQFRQEHKMISGFSAKHCEAAGIVLARTLRQILGDSFVPEVKAACFALYDIIVSSFMGTPPSLEQVEFFLEMQQI
eukprot:TRINITY_DN35037_c0_g1_i1.p1 TRINITY_DN35037_c0_g1~~TRINITY_DN35037_c0_g1_i1.p1  ORF type:complete len:176 (+),score=32.68 TRINITY_DN35037_c0_g1_i1:52-579(+)